MSLTRRMLLVAALLSLPVLLATVATAAAENPAKIKVLLIDGQNVSAHDWKVTTPVIKEGLEKSGRFEVEILTSPPKGAAAKDAWAKFAPDFSKYGVVFLNYAGDKWPDDVMKNFVTYVENGGGLLVYHFSCAAFPESPAFDKMIGIGWSRDPKTNEGLYIDAAGKEVRRAKGEGKGGFHGPAHEFPCSVFDKADPITAGLPARWMHIKDELYGSLRGPAKDMHVLVTAFSDKAKGGTGESEPMVWTIPFGKGRVCVNVLGHMGQETAAADTMILLARGTEWAATGKVTLPVPADFPKAAPAVTAPAATPTAVLKADESKQGQVEPLAADLAARDRQIAEMTAERTNQEARLTALAAQLTGMKNNYDMLATNLKTAQTQRDDAMKHQDDLVRMNSDLATSLNLTRKELDASKEQLREMASSLASERSKLAWIRQNYPDVKLPSTVPPGPTGNEKPTPYK